VCSFGVAESTHSLWLGLLAGIAVGAALALLHAIWSISLRANQIVSGVALVILGSGLSSLIGSYGSNPLTVRPSVGVFGNVFSGAITRLPIVGPILFGQTILVYGSWAFVAISSYYLYRTRRGMWVRAVGEDPASADSTGVAVASTRYVHTVIGGAAAGLAGAYLTLALFGAWQDNLSAGEGWIAFSIVIFAGWRPWLALVVAYVFGALTNLGFNLQLLNVSISSQLLAVAPFVVGLVALLVISATRLGRDISPPAGLGLPFWREDR
jgi:general nucleoside transport system permease protein